MKLEDYCYTEIVIYHYVGTAGMSMVKHVGLVPLETMEKLYPVTLQKYPTASVFHVHGSQRICLKHYNYNFGVDLKHYL